MQEKLQSLQYKLTSVLIITVQRKESDLLQMKVTKIYADGQNFLIFIDSHFWGVLCHVNW